MLEKGSGLLEHELYMPRILKYSDQMCIAGIVEPFHLPKQRMVGGGRLIQLCCMRGI